MPIENALAAIVLILCLASCQNSPSLDTLLENRQSRLTQGRLAAVQTYQPSENPDSAKSPTLEELERWTELDRVLRRAMNGQPTPQQLLVAAYIDLFFDDYANAALTLQELLAMQGDTALILNDLAVVMLEWAQAEGQPLDLLEALRLSSRSTAAQPECAPCQFNHALSLSHLNLRYSAVEAWKAFIHQDPQSPWAGEAESWIARLSSSYEENLDELRSRLLSSEPLTEGELRAFAQSMPEEVRTIAEENLLDRWARAREIDDSQTADFWLARARLVARLLAQRGSWLLADAISQLETTSPPESTHVHKTFSLAMSAYHDQDFVRAEELLTTAEQAFIDVGSVYADVAALYRAICIYYRDADSARPRLESLLERASSERYPSLVGRTLWMLGILDMVQRRTDLALQRFTRMKPMLEISMGADRAAIAETMIAETLELRGETEKSWKHRLHGLSRLVYGTDVRRRHSALLEAAQALARRGDAELALIFLDEVVVNASHWHQPLAEAEAFSARARAHFLADDQVGARRDIELAFEALEEMPTGDPLRERTTRLTHLYLGMLTAREKPEAGLQIMQQAHEALEAGGWHEEHLEYLKQRAQTLLAMGDVKKGGKILLASVQEIERLRKQTEDTMSRLEILRHAQGFHEALIRLALDLGDRESFEQAERARGRELLRQEEDEPTLLRLQAALQEGETLLLFTSLPEDLWAWIVEKDRFERLRLGIDRSQLQQQCELFLSALRVGDRSTVKRLGQSLHSILIEPLTLSLNSKGRLIFVPDLMLAKLPFAALFDGAKGKFLIEETTLAQVPSVRLFLRNRLTPKAPIQDTALVVADPDLNDSNFASLEPLKQARPEARRVAKLYPKAKLVVGREATAVEVLAQLPHFTIFHFAGHAFASGPDLADSLLLLSRDAEGRSQLAADDVRKQELQNLRVAVLAACHSAEGVRKGREAAASLATAFLGAGASSVVATRWDVEDSISLYHKNVSLREKSGTSSCDHYWRRG